MIDLHQLSRPASPADITSWHLANDRSPRRIFSVHKQTTQHVAFNGYLLVVVMYTQFALQIRDHQINLARRPVGTPTTVNWPLHEAGVSAHAAAISASACSIAALRLLPQTNAALHYAGTIRAQFHHLASFFTRSLARDASNEYNASQPSAVAGIYSFVAAGIEINIWMVIKTIARAMVSLQCTSAWLFGMQSTQQSTTVSMALIELEIATTPIALVSLRKCRAIQYATTDCVAYSEALKACFCAI